MTLLIVLEIVVFFLEYFIAAITEVVSDDTKEIELSSKATSAFIFRIMKCSFAVKLNDVCKEIGITIEEVFIFGLVKEDISSGASKKGVCEQNKFIYRTAYCLQLYREKVFGGGGGGGREGPEPGPEGDEGDFAYVLPSLATQSSY